MAPSLDDEWLELKEKLADIEKDKVRFNRLANIEQMILNDILYEQRHLRCAGCRKWAQALIDKVEKQNGRE